MQEGCLEIKNLTIGYKSKTNIMVVFENLNATFKRGMFVGIIGKNGLGKSTLLRTVSGLQEKIRGEIWINSKKIELIERNELAKLVSVILTEKVGGFNLTVHDLISLGRIPYTNSSHELKAEDVKVIEECTTLLGLNALKEKAVNELSDGLFQKTMIAKGLAQETAILLLDEPTAYLDFPSKHQLFLLLKTIVDKQKNCIITSSHDIELLIKYATHFLIMGEGNQFEFIEASNYKTSELFSKVTNGYFS